MTSPQESANTQILKILMTTNKLLVKAFNASTLKNLAFIIVNDTYQVFPYDKAILWDMRESKPLAISGMPKVEKETELFEKWTTLIPYLKSPETAQMLSQDSFTEHNELFQSVLPTKETIVYWIPIVVGNVLRLGFWAEMWKPTKALGKPESQLEFVSKTVIPGFASAWARLDTKHSIKPILKDRRLWFYLTPTALLFLMGMKVPLRIAAPCEVAPNKPFVVTAPLDGIIEEVLVKPGQEVHVDDALVHYDKTVPLEELRAAAKQVEITQAEIHRATTLGLADQKPLADLEILKFKLEKDMISLDLAKKQASKLQVNAQKNGIAVISDPDLWRGKPVKIGEKFMTLADPKNTKIKFWLPEADNVHFDLSKPITIILNIAPSKSYYAKIDYISYESVIDENQISSFLGEAMWDSPHDDVKVGLKGTATIYGEEVSLFYFIIRKPWSTLRRISGF